MTYFVHPSSYIDDNATVGDGTRIWHFSHIMGDAKIGVNVTIGQNVFVGRGVLVGDNCKIQNNVAVYEGVMLEDGVFCGPSAVFTNVKWPRAEYPANPEGYMKTLVKHGCSIGANATIICGTELGRYSFIGAGSVVTESVPDYGFVYGSPARLMGWVCACTEKLIFVDGRSQCTACSRTYRQYESQVVTGED
jgi:UDP-2-acetamido-3-amino-2,3-dideoxy-glucuronate N-acetyltransferase